MPAPTHPLDFPQPWQKPTFTALLSCLQTLKLEPPSWGAKPKPKSGALTGLSSEDENRLSRAKHRQLVTSYLTRIISSPLSWIASDDEKEVLWEEASRRLSERCGRTAMGEMTRYWPFLAHAQDEPSQDFTLAVREPPLTGDHLGLKTWCSSYLIAQHLPNLHRCHLTHLFPPDTPAKPPASSSGTDSGYTSSGDAYADAAPSPAPRPAVLELGSGTGLLGLAAAIHLQTHVHLTDLPAILTNLRRNAETNAPLISSRGGSVAVNPLTWGADHLPNPIVDDDDNGGSGGGSFSLILAADPLYDHDHPSLLAGAIDAHLSPSAAARCIVAVPLRDQATRDLLASFRAEMAAARTTAIICADEGVVEGQDDWSDGGSGDDDGGGETGASHVECWWGVFKREGSC